VAFLVLLFVAGEKNTNGLRLFEKNWCRDTQRLMYNK
jgi:hypothetical protein